MQMPGESEGVNKAVKIAGRAAQMVLSSTEIDESVAWGLLEA
jgi:hypothetical protein